MKLDVSVATPMTVTADTLVLERYAGEDRPGPELRRVDAALGGFLGLALRDQRFEGRAAEVADIHTGGRLAAKRVLVVGLGARGECTAEVLRRAAAAAARRARDLGAASVAISVPGAGARGLDLTARAQATGEGVLLGLYRFDRYKEKRNGDRAVGGPDPARPVRARPRGRPGGASARGAGGGGDLLRPRPHQRAREQRDGDGARRDGANHRARVRAASPRPRPGRVRADGHGRVPGREPGQRRAAPLHSPDVRPPATGAPPDRADREGHHVRFRRPRPQDRRGHGDA